MCTSQKRHRSGRLRKSFLVFVGSVALGALGGAVAIGPAQAAGPADQDKAKALLRQGAAQMQTGEYTAALASFENAYALVPNPKIHYNLGNAYAALARPAQAHGAFVRFLEEAEDAPAEFVRKARERIGELRSQVASVRVTTEPSGAEITIDGRAIGRTPLPGPVLLDPGPHSAIATFGRVTVTESLTVSAGQTRTLLLILREPQREPAAFALPAAQEVRTTDAHDREDPPPVYRRAWLWGVVAAVAVGAGAAFALSSRDPSYPRAADTQVQW